MSYNDGSLSTNLHLNGFVLILLAVLRCSVSVKNSLLLALFSALSLKALYSAQYNSFHILKI